MNCQHVYRSCCTKALTESTLENVRQALASGHTQGDGPFTARCQEWLRDRCDVAHALLTTSCSTALDMCALLCDVGPGDEVILPSFTFVSTANAFLARGATLRFVEISPQTLNINPESVADAVTERTKVIVPVHYAGMSCDMARILEIAQACSAIVVEDAAQGINASWRGRALGSIGNLGTLSFHATKNVSCGEGGALLFRDEEFVERGQIIREKGTNRAAFIRGEVDKYTWQDLGSSYLPSDLLAAVLLDQFSRVSEITGRRLELFGRYMERLAELTDSGRVQLPQVPGDCLHNGHIFYILMPDSHGRDELISYLRKRSIPATFHYVPLHTSPMGLKLGYSNGDMPVTESVAGRLIRLPISNDMTLSDVDTICSAILQWCREH